jgi:hypothetical protein
MSGLRVTDELDEYRLGLERLTEIREEVAMDMLMRLDSLARENKNPILIFDTYITAIMERYTRPDGTQFNQRDALNVVLSALAVNKDRVKNDGTIITFKHKMITCVSGHRYSEVHKTCPDPMHRINP